MIGNAGRTAGRGVSSTNSITRYPTPSKGMDLSNSLNSGDLSHCLYTYNMCPFEYGLRVRQGFREWQIDVENSSGTGVNTLIPFDNASEGTAGNKLFAVTNEGIWDVTEGSATPIQVVVFTEQSSDAGFGTYCHYVNDAERDVLFYADSLNGLYSYDAENNTWTNTGILDNLDEAEVKFVMSHKNNVWFAVKDSTVGYYLPIRASQGTVTPQYFGDKFRHGGALVGLFSWTVDGGAGIDDILVAVSRAGDVILYTGSGPESGDWGMKGIYFVGEIPNTPSFGSEQGGELYLLSVYGIISMGDMLRGVDTAELQTGVEGSSMAFKIAGLIREDMERKLKLRGWNVALVPSEGAIVISTPTIGTEAPIQYYYNLAMKGWGLWRDVPMVCFTEYESSVFFGTKDNRVMRMDTNLDEVKITPVEGETNGADINFSVLTAYTALGAAGTYKKVSLIRPDFLSTIPASYTSQARYDFDIEESRDTDIPPPVLNPIGLWDLSAWEADIWGSSALVPRNKLSGTWGKGRYIAIATRGSSRTRTRLVGWDIFYDTGGML